MLDGSELCDVHGVRLDARGVCSVCHAVLSCGYEFRPDGGLRVFVHAASKPPPAAGDQSEFLAALDALAAERCERARAVPKEKRCRICNGIGSRMKYVLPEVIGPAECTACNGTGEKK
jgi:hypothetical protein